MREALRRLEGDGHLVRDASGGLRPRVPDVRTMHELYDVRLALEDLTVRRATSAGDREMLLALRREWERLGEVRRTAPKDEQPDFVAADEAFHLDVAAASGNDAARGYLEEITERIHVLRIQGFTIESRIDATVDEHLEILDAMLAGDADVAAGSCAPTCSATPRWCARWSVRHSLGCSAPADGPPSARPSRSVGCGRVERPAGGSGRCRALESAAQREPARVCQDERPGDRERRDP